MRDESYSPFRKTPEPPPRETATAFVTVRPRGDQSDSMRGSLRTAVHGYEAVYLLNGEIYQSQWFASEALARADLATHQEILAAAGWMPVPFKP